jgi:phosphate starvation-inducible PhoH-like protein
VAIKADRLDIDFRPVDNTRLAALCGPLDAHLRQIEISLDVSIRRRGAHFTVQGARAEEGLGALEYFYNQSQEEISVEDIQLGLVALARGGANEAPAVLRTRRVDLRPRTAGQAQYLEQILDHDITFGIGPAGTGKTYLAVACAVDALERDTVQRIILTRPAVEAGERLGFLPGDLTQKVDPYLRPLYDALYDLLGFDKVVRLIERNTIEIAPLAFMRGRTLNHAFVLLDEAQNTTPEQMQMFLTRVGFGTRAVINGDPTQIDLPRGAKCGLKDAEAVLQGVRGIAFSYFTKDDVVRHPLVARIVEAYAEHRKPA